MEQSRNWNMTKMMQTMIEDANHYWKQDVSRVDLLRVSQQLSYIVQP